MIVPGKKIIFIFGGLLFKLSCMKITFYNLFCHELYATLQGSFLIFGGSFGHFEGLFRPEPPCIFFTGLFYFSHQQESKPKKKKKKPKTTTPKPKKESAKTKTKSPKKIAVKTPSKQTKTKASPVKSPKKTPQKRNHDVVGKINRLF